MNFTKIWLVVEVSALAFNFYALYVDRQPITIVAIAALIYMIYRDVESLKVR